MKRPILASLIAAGLGVFLAASTGCLYYHSHSRHHDNGQHYGNDPDGPPGHRPGPPPGHDGPPPGHDGPPPGHHDGGSDHGGGRH